MEGALKEDADPAARRSKCCVPFRPIYGSCIAIRIDDMIQRCDGVEAVIEQPRASKDLTKLTVSEHQLVVTLGTCILAKVVLDKVSTPLVPLVGLDCAKTLYTRV